ncbi:MAG TPA: hypothetical protein VGD72_07625 [Mycobacteriales bacterium]
MRLRRHLGSTVLALAVTAGILWPGVAASAVPDPANAGVQFTATVNGRDARTIDANVPVRLVPDDGADVVVTATNGGSAPLTVRSVRLDGRVFGLTFFKYTTRVDLELAPGAQGSRHFLVDLDDLGGQATGLLPARLTVLGARHEVLGATDLAVDVRGSVLSLYGVFGIVVGAATLLLLAALLFGLATQRLPANRWSRATRFLVPGVGLGLSLTFTLSALRVLTPNPLTWLALVLVCGGVAFGLGYLSPAPASGEDEEEDDGGDTGEDDVRAGYAPELVPPSAPPTPPRPW